MRERVQILAALLLSLVALAPPASAETPEEWIALPTAARCQATRIVGDVRPGRRRTSCPYAADSVGLALYASAEQGSLQIAADKAPAGAFAAHGACQLTRRT
jgi:hypothetical protein